MAEPVRGPRPTLPTVSVVVPFYHGGSTLPHTLGSLADQDYAPLELLIVDDGGTEAIAPLVKAAFSGRLTSVRILRHLMNEGLSRSLNDGWRGAAGDFVLFIHQDIELLGRDWLRRAVAILQEHDDVQVLTCNYGIPAQRELTFAGRAFGLLRRQFHDPSPRGPQLVTFTEFKCDLVRKTTLERIGGFPTNFRLAGEDIVASYHIRQDGGKILKAFDLQGIQRFEGTSGTIRGNLWKEYRFGMAFAGVLFAFRRYAFRDLGSSSYSKARSLHRASQPMTVAVGAAFLILGVLFAQTWLLELVAFLVGARFVWYAVRLWPRLRRLLPSAPRTTAESFGASVLGLASDVVYTAGLCVGLLRAAVGAPL